MAPCDDGAFPGAGQAPKNGASFNARLYRHHELIDAAEGKLRTVDDP